MVVSLAWTLWLPYPGVHRLPVQHQQVTADHLNLPGKITDTWLIAVPSQFIAHSLEHHFVRRLPDILKFGS